MRKNKNMPLRVAMIVDEFMQHVFFLLMYILVTILCVCVCLKKGVYVILRSKILIWWKLETLLFIFCCLFIEFDTSSMESLNPFIRV